MRTNAGFHRVGDPEHGYWYHADDAVIIGDVEIGVGSSIWYCSVLRGDDAAIRIGRRVNIQDLTMVHADPDKPLTIGDDVTVGHRAIIHCRTIGSDCLIGMGAILMEDVVVGSGSLIGAGSVVPPGTVVPPSSLVRGVPGKIVRQTTDEERQGILHSVEKYAENAMYFFEHYGFFERYRGPEEDEE